MPLPSVPQIFHSLTIPGTKTRITFRPFTQGEYKKLLHASSIGDEFSFIETFKDIIKHCVKEKTLDVDSLPLYQIEYIFLMIRGKSVGETITATYKCKNKIPSPETPKEGVEEDSVKEELITCDTTFDVNINLSKATINYPKGFNQKAIIKINESIGIKLRPPTINTFKKDEEPVSLSDEYIFSSIECVYDGENVLVPNTDFSFEEFVSFAEGFSLKTVGEIGAYLNNQPKIFLELDVVCPRCKSKETIKFDGLNDFFS